MFEINKPPLGEGGWGLIEDLQYSVNVKYKKFHLDEISLYSSVISNGNRTEWSPILPVIIQVINKIRGLGRRRPICLVTSMIIDQIELDDMMFCFINNINHNCNNLKHKIL